MDSQTRPPSFDSDVSFLARHTEVILLHSEDDAAWVAVAPGFQGRVMTSSCAGLSGRSRGYVHRAGVRLGARQPHITVVGGEDRFWLGPEGGQYGLYFPQGAAFDYEHWQVPEDLDFGPWPVTHRSTTAVAFHKAMQLTNWSGTRFELEVRRTVRLLDAAAIRDALGHDVPPELACVGFESDNRITNVGAHAWRKDTGLLSIWILGMFPPTPDTTIVLPYRSGSTEELGPIVNDAYFGAIPRDRLQIVERAVLYRGDGCMRGKIGLSPRRARPVVGSYAKEAELLTLVSYSLTEHASDYVDSTWQRQSEPYGGDVVHAYNDGPLEPGGVPLGPFYELETSSRAAALAPNESLDHTHRTFHLQGPAQQLDVLSRAVLGIGLGELPAPPAA